jgi:hypothetical protein
MNERNPQFIVTFELSIVAGGFWFSESLLSRLSEGGSEGGREEETVARNFAMQQAVD